MAEYVAERTIQALRITPDTMASEVAAFDRDFRLAGWMNDGWLVKDPGIRWVSVAEFDVLYRERRASSLSQVAGHCPACGGILARDASGVIICTEAGCPDTLAAHKVLAEDETEHIVSIEPERFHVKHPLRERIDDALLSCGIHARISNLPVSVVDAKDLGPGIYRVTDYASGLNWERVA